MLALNPEAVHFLAKRFVYYKMLQCRMHLSEPICEWIPREGKRVRAREKVGWADEIRKFAGITWRHQAKYRVDWRHMGEAFALQWA